MEIGLKIMYWLATRKPRPMLNRVAVIRVMNKVINVKILDKKIWNEVEALMNKKCFRIF